MELSVLRKNQQRLSESIACFFKNANWLIYSFIFSFFAFITPVIFVITVLLSINKKSDTSDNIANNTQIQLPSIPEFLTQIFNTCILTPIIETLVIHLLPMLALTKLIKNSKIIIITSSLLFGFTHIRKSYMAVFITTIAGLYFASAYLHWLKKDNSHFSACKVVCTIHGIYNFYYVILSYIPASLIF